MNDPLIGQKFNKLIVIEKIRINCKRFYKGFKVYRYRYKCICDCGKECIRKKDDLITGKIKSCGCSALDKIRKPSQERSGFQDHTNQRFGSLVAVRYIMLDKGHGLVGYWMCKCDCGLETTVTGYALRTNRAKSCGCRIGPPPSDRIYYRVHTYQWRRAVLYRDKECVKCHSKEQLQAHHIESVVNNPELVSDVNNGVTLCDTCHKRFHFIYSYSDANKENLLKYLD